MSEHIGISVNSRALGPCVQPNDDAWFCRQGQSFINRWSLILGEKNYLVHGSLTGDNKEFASGVPFSNAYL